MFTRRRAGSGGRGSARSSSTSVPKGDVGHRTAQQALARRAERESVDRREGQLEQQRRGRGAPAAPARREQGRMAGTQHGVALVVRLERTRKASTALDAVVSGRPPECRCPSTRARRGSSTGPSPRSRRGSCQPARLDQGRAPVEGAKREVVLVADLPRIEERPAPVHVLELAEAQQRPPGRGASVGMRCRGRSTERAVVRLLRRGRRRPVGRRSPRSVARTPVMRAGAGPWLAWRITRTPASSRRSYAARVAGSVAPSSTTMTSAGTSGSGRRQPPRRGVSASLKQGMTTATDPATGATSASAGEADDGMTSSHAEPPLGDPRTSGSACNQATSPDALRISTGLHPGCGGCGGDVRSTASS